MAGSSWSTFLKSIGIPLLIALSLYAFTSLIFLPLYRRHRSCIRYSDYTPLGSTLAQRTTSLFEPYFAEEGTVVQKLRGVIGRGVRWALGSRWARWEERGIRGGRMEEHEEEDDEQGGLFDAESGEAMVGFDFQRERRGRGRVRGFSGTNGRDVIARVSADTGADGNRDVDMDDSNRRLSRDLEEGFKDDSGSEDSDEEVTAGRRSVSRRRH